MNKYKDFSDERLVEEYKSGDQYAFDEIYERYKKAVKIIANKFFLQGGNKDDLLQEGTIGLVKAVNAYNGSVAFSNFAFTCIRNNIISAVLSYACKRHSFLNEGISLDDKEVGSIAFEDPLNLVIENEEKEEYISKIEVLLSDAEKDVLNLALKGYSYKEIALELDKNPKSIDNAIQRIKNKLKKTKYTT